MSERSQETMESGPFPVRPGRPDCSYYMKTGLCKFGLSCRYNHPPNRNLVIAFERTETEYPERAGEPECQYYLKTGLCKYGATCKFHHPKGKAASAGGVSLNGFGYPLRPNEAECAYYMKTGICKFGSACKFHHPPPSAMMLPLRRPYVHTSLQSPTSPGQQPYQAVATNWPRTSFVNSPRWRGSSSYTPLLVPQGLVSVPSWNAYSGQMGASTSADSQQQPAGNSEIGGASSRNEGSQETMATYHVASAPIGLYAYPIENVFPERPGKPECQFYMKTGHCKFGASCKFHHPRERNIIAPTSFLSPYGLPSRPGEPPCFYFCNFGICKYGPSCKYDHPLEIPRHNPSVFRADGPGHVGSSSRAGTLSLPSGDHVEAEAEKFERLALSDSDSPNNGED